MPKLNRRLTIEEKIGKGLTRKETQIIADGITRRGFIGGGMAIGAYWIAIWAMTVAPIALVAALRESSVLFASAIAVVFLKEPLLPPRVVAALMILAGVVLIRLQ